MAKNQFDLTIIIVNYNGQNWLKKTLTTLKRSYLDRSKYAIKTVVVDNASTDNSVQMIQTEFPWVELIKSSQNIGFAAGNNIALKQSTSRYSMLLNSDMEFDSRSNLDHLIDFLDDQPKVGVITPQLVLTNGQLDPACHRGEPTPWASLTYFSGLEKRFPSLKLFSQYHQYYKDLSITHQIDACSGAAMVVRTSALEKVGLLDEQFFMYAEDLDWCKRFREAGYQIIFYPSVIVIHHKNKSGRQSTSPKTSQTTTTHFYDTMLAYFDKHYQTKYPRVVRQFIKYIIKIKKGAK